MLLLAAFLGCFCAQILSTGALSIVVSNPLQFGSAAVMGFMVNTLAYTSIKLASSLTLKVGLLAAVLSLKGQKDVPDIAAYASQGIPELKLGKHL